MSSLRRPSSSMSQRTVSGLSLPPTSISRPSSVASHRTASRTSHRPLSRLSSRQSRALCQTLVTKLTGLTAEGGEDYDLAYDLIIRRIEGIGKQPVSPDFRSALTELNGFSRKARIQVHDELAEALNIISKRLRIESEKRGDLDNEISASKLSEHLQLLVSLAELHLRISTSPPSSSTLEFSARLVDRIEYPDSITTAITWADIMTEEPFEGQHWQGAYGLAPGSIVGQDEHTGSTESSPLLSPVSDTELADREDLLSSHGSEETADISEGIITPPLPGPKNDQLLSQARAYESLRLRFELEALQKRQYWRGSWQSDAPLNQAFNIAEPASLRLSFLNILSSDDRAQHERPGNKRTINEHDAIREILISLQGRSSSLFERKVNEHGLPTTIISEDCPSLAHLTPSTHQSILSTFARLATTLKRLRIFVANVVQYPSNSSPQVNNSRTLEAFAEALELQIARFDARMARTEGTMLRAHLQSGECAVVSLLSLEKALREEFSECFDELLTVVHLSFPNLAWLSRDRLSAQIRLSPSSFASKLLDLLFDIIQKKQSFGDLVTASWLMHVFLKTAEPVWKMLGRWLRDGIFMPEAGNTNTDQSILPQEFFIEYRGLDVVDSDFWEQGFNLRSRFMDEKSSSECYSVPIFLRSLADNILGAGKSIGLLRILGQSESFVHEKLAIDTWPTFATYITKLYERNVFQSGRNPTKEVTSMSAENLSLLLSDYLLPTCTRAENMLKDVLYNDCDLMHHLCATEDLFLSGKGDVMTYFCDVLFSAIDAKKLWMDYHFLNTVFREAMGSRNVNWVDSSLVRLSYKTGGKPAADTIKCFDGLSVDYAAPFPLIFIINGGTLQVYNAIFVLLLKIRRAKTALDNILLKATAATTLRTPNKLRIFYASRSKLSWVVNTFLDFICHPVLHVEVQRFHASLRGAGSLNDIIDLHEKHLHTLEKFCFLEEKMTVLQRALLAILDISVLFGNCFVAYAGDTYMSTSHLSMPRSHRHRSRRQRLESLDVVSYAPLSSYREGDSVSSESDLDESQILEDMVRGNESHFADVSNYESFGEEEFLDYNEKILKVLDSRVRYIRREVDRLELTSGGSQFGVLAFSLQAWDL